MVSTVLLDLDGVVWLGDRMIPGSTEAVADLRRAGWTVAFVTNNSSVPTSDVEAKLGGMGIPAGGAVVTSALVAASLVEQGERVLCAGGPGLREALVDRGAEVVSDGGADTVVVGYHRDFDYERMRIASTAVRQGARLLASNDDATYPSAEGLIPGAGAILAGIEKASGVRATVAGKPNRPMADYVRERFGPTGWVVGDRLDTDGALARAVGWRFGLVLTGVAGAVDVGQLGDAAQPDVVADDLASLAPRLIPS